MDEVRTTARWAAMVRPWIFAVASALVVLAIHAVAVWQDVDPNSPRTEYGLHFAAMTVAALALGAVWFARRRGHTWDADLLPAMFGGLAALSLLTALHGTPFDVFGLQGDQGFRSAAVTRFADSWLAQDYTYQGKPAYYAPGYFWVLGRAADLLAIEPWRMLKYGTIAVAFLVPIVSYLMWRRLVPLRVAAMISATPLIVPELYESYGWLVQVVIIPWWLEAVFGYRRADLPRRNPVLLGLIGAVLFCVYYYFFFVFIIAFALYVAVMRWRGDLDWGQVRRGLGVLAIAAAGSAVFWAPLAWNFLTAQHFHSLNNRWMSSNAGDLALPMLEPSVFGLLCLVGLVYLLWTYTEQLSRLLLIVLVSLYLWHAVGFLFLAVDTPLMSFRMKTLVPIVLLAAAALALARVVDYAAERLPAERVGRVAMAAGLLLVIFASDLYVSRVTDDKRVEAAHDQPFPSGRLPGFHSPTAKPLLPPAAQIRAAIEADYRGSGHAVVFSDRSDLFAFYPYFGFIQWNANYSHPTARYHDRLSFLRDLAKAATPAEFARLSASNEFDRIDAIVLKIEGESLRFVTYDDDFPFGTKAQYVIIPKQLVQPDHFTITTANGYLIAVRK